VDYALEGLHMFLLCIGRIAYDGLMLLCIDGFMLYILYKCVCLKLICMYM
jgi:hypothetical protein